MNPIDFLFQLVSDRLTISPDDYQNVVNRATESYTGSKVEEFFKKHWYIPLALIILLPIIKSRLNAWIDGFGDQDKDGDNDMMDVVLSLFQNRDKLQSVKRMLEHGA